MPYRRLILAAMVCMVCSLMATPSAHAGTFEVQSCGGESNTLANASNWGLYRSFGMEGPVVSGLECPDTGTVDSGLHSKARYCNSGTFTAANSSSDLSVCAHSAANGGPDTGNPWDGTASLWAISVPTGAYISSFYVTRSYRTSVKTPYGVTRYQFQIYGEVVKRGAWAPHFFEGCNNDGSSTNPWATAGTPDIGHGVRGTNECVMGTGSPASTWGQPTTTFSQGELAGSGDPYPMHVRYYALCAPNNNNWSELQEAVNGTGDDDWLTNKNLCPVMNGAYTHYAYRFNWRSSRTTVTDETNPAIVSTTPSWNPACAYRPDGTTAQSGCSNASGWNITGRSTDNTGTYMHEARVNGGAQGQVIPGTCALNASAVALRPVPCPTDLTATSSFAAPTTTGTHTVAYRAMDISSNWGTSANTSLKIDNTVPSAGDPTCDPAMETCWEPTPAGCASSDAGISSVSPLAGSTTNWVKGTIAVAGFACENQFGTSGSSAVQMSVNGGGWSNLCNLTEAGPGVTSTAICSLDTTAYTQGTELRFRVHHVDMAGNSTPTNPEGPYRVDNTAPTFASVTARPTAPTASVEWQNDVNTSATFTSAHWTNATETRADFANSDSTGSGTNRVETEYTPGTCAVETDNRDVGTFTQKTYTQNRAQSCRQGTHTFRVRARDRADNWSAWQTITYRYDSAPTREATWATSNADKLIPGSALAVSPSGWQTSGSAFTIGWTNATYNGTTQAPIAENRVRVGSSPVWKVRTTCTGSGASCGPVTLATGLAQLNGTALTESEVFPGGGSHQIKLWLADAAGNTDEENAITGVVNIQDTQCLVPGA